MTGPAIHQTFGEDTARVRRTDPRTSHEAADLTDPARSIGLVLLTLGDRGPLADHEIVTRLRHSGFADSRIRTAREALVKHGLVAPTGERRRTPHGRFAEVRGLTAEGKLRYRRASTLRAELELISDIGRLADDTLAGLDRLVGA